MELGLGTVQFGLDYGVSNESGKVPDDEARAIVDYAYGNGIRLLDTAASYGDSESVLGRITERKDNFRIVTKLPPVNADRTGLDHVTNLQTAFMESLTRLRRKRVAGLLLHRPSNLFLPVGDEIYQLMSLLKSQGLTERIGVSVYEADELDRIFERFDFDIVQAPVNVLDQRLVRSGHLERLKEKGVEIHIRSALLQGLLVIPPKRLHPYFKPIEPVLRRWHGFLENSGMSPLEGALGYVRRRVPCDVVLVGVTCVRELTEIVEAFKTEIPPDMDFSSFSIVDAEMVNPGKWNLR